MLPFWWAATGVVLVFTACLGWQSYEHRRFARARLRQRHRVPYHPRVLLVVPCKGLDLELEANLAALLEQDYPCYQATFVIETPADAALPVILNAIAGHPQVPARVLVAGTCHSGGQKVHNLRAATGDLPADVTVLAFVDSDARPKPPWLAALVRRLARPICGATTGYRWMVPQRTTLANLLLHSINAVVASLLSNYPRSMVWGGAWAIRRETWERLRVREAWKGTLSDDLVVSRVVHSAGLEVHFEPACMLPSPCDANLRTLFGFLRRQHQMGRFYAGRVWYIGLAWNTLATGVMWGLPTLAVVAWVLGHPQAPWMAASGLLLYGIQVARGWLRQSLLRLYLPSESGQLSTAMKFDLWWSPLGGLVNWLAMLAALAGRRVVWRGIVYQVDVAGQATRHELSATFQQAA